MTILDLYLCSEKNFLGEVVLVEPVKLKSAMWRFWTFRGLAKFYNIAVLKFLREFLFSLGLKGACGTIACVFCKTPLGKLEGLPLPN